MPTVGSRHSGGGPDGPKRSEPPVYSADSFQAHHPGCNNSIRAAPPSSGPLPHRIAAGALRHSATQRVRLGTRDLPTLSGSSRRSANRRRITRQCVLLEGQSGKRPYHTNVKCCTWPRRAQDMLLCPSRIRSGCLSSSARRHRTPDERRNESLGLLPNQSYLAKGSRRPCLAPPQPAFATSRWIAYLCGVLPCWWRWPWPPR